MARIKGVKPTGRATRRPGRFMTRTGRDGSIVAQKWPKKRGRIRSELQRETARQFGLAQKRAGKAFSWEKIEAENLSKGTIWNWREFLVLTAYGQLYTFEDQDGNYYGNWFIMADQIQVYLDTITDEAGSLLVRDADKWIALIPGAAGYVLQTNGPAALPSWEPVASGADGSQWAITGSDTANTGGQPTKGLFFVPAMDMVLSEVSFCVTKQTGYTYLATIAEWVAGNTVGAIKAQWTCTADIAPGHTTNKVVLPTPVFLTAHQPYVLLLSLDTGSPLAGISIFLSQSLLMGYPVDGNGFLVSTPARTPIVGSALTFTTGAAAFGFKWKDNS